MTIIKSFQNGTYQVDIKQDGTKIRTGSVFVPDFPESLDMKITDYCDLACPFCHEKSTKRGKHSLFETIQKRLSGLPEGVEIAIGGGNPLDHPHIEDILKFLKYEKGFIPNITINSKHLTLKKYQDIFEKYVQPHIYGMGISGDVINPYSHIANTVNHFIIGEQSVRDLINISKNYSKVLLLGYKTYGFGEKYGKVHSKRIEKNIREIKTYMKYVYTGETKNFSVISFDNLAIKQLDVFNNMKNFNNYYMGEDGEYTMYFDAVTDTYAKSSTNNRLNFTENNNTIVQAFKTKEWKD